MSITKASAVIAALLIGAAGLAGCGEPTAKTGTPPAPAGPPPPPSPELPMTGAKAREIVAALPITCLEMASLKMDMVLCDERQNKPTDHAALRTELRDLSWTLQKGTPEEAAARCSAILGELRSQPKPQVCYDLGMN
jgi:hypothetical protein